MLAFVSGKGERVRPDSYKGVPVRYSIAALEEKEGKKGATHEVSGGFCGLLSQYSVGARALLLVGVTLIT